MWFYTTSVRSFAIGLAFLIAGATTTTVDAASCVTQLPTCPSGQKAYYLPTGSEQCTGGGYVCSAVPTAKTSHSASGMVSTRVGDSNAKGTASLSFGSRGAAVIALQQQLVSLGYLSSDSTTGYFGTLTRSAVRQFQCDKLNICSGSEDTTGYGSAGPRTGQAIATALATGGTRTTTNPTTTSSANTSTSGIQATINALLAQIQTLQAKIAALTGSASSGTTATTYSSTPQTTQTATTGTSNTNTHTQTTTNAPCTFNGQTVAHGASVTAYHAASVPAGQTCQSQTRTCSNGTLSGTYGYTSCTVAEPQQTITAVSLGQDGSDFVGTRNLSADGTKDVHIRLSGVTKTISSVRITPDVGSGVWQSPDNGTNWVIAVRPQSGSTNVDLYFAFNKDWSYNVQLTFTDGSSATVAAAPTVSCSGNVSCFTAALNNLFAHFWTGARDTGHIIPTGWTGVVGGSFDGSDWRGSTWPGALFLSVMYTQYLLDPTDAHAQPIRSQWSYLRSRFSDSDFTAVGASSPMNVWLDDTSTNMQMLLEIYAVTHDERALSLAKTALQNGWNHWHNDDPRFGGGLWYTDDHTEESLHQVQYALNAWRVYELTGDQTMLAHSQEVYNWIQTHMWHTDDVYYMDYGWWSSDNQATDQPHVNWWGGIQEGVIEVSQSYLAGVMGMDTMHARMYRLTGDEQYKTRAIATARGLIKNFVGNNGAFFDDRDAWANGLHVREWILEVYPLLPSDLQQQFKTAFQRTAQGIHANNTTSDGYYGPCWTGPVECVWSNLAADQHNKQSMVNTQVVDFIAAPALIDYVEAHPTTTGAPVTAVLLGTDGIDVVGTKTVGADGIGDVHIRLSGVSSPVSRVVITPTSGAGMWQSPADGTNWIVSVQPHTDITVVDLYFEYYEAYTSYQVALTFQNGTTQTLTVR